MSTIGRRDTALIGQANPVVTMAVRNNWVHAPPDGFVSKKRLSTPLNATAQTSKKRESGSESRRKRGKARV